MRILAFVVCFGVVLAGCASSPPAESTSTTHPKCATTHDYESQPVPDLPTNVTRDSAEQFAITHAEAIAWNHAYRDADTGMGANVYKTSVNETDDGYLLYVEGGVGYYTCSDGQLAVTDGMFYSTYFINNSTALRLNRPTNRTDDPREHGGVPVA